MNAIKRWVAAAAFVGAAGCVTTPKELVGARDAYREASLGPAPLVSPAEMAESKRFLDAANSQFETRGNVRSVRDNAYVAMRDAQIADARARTAANVAVTIRLLATQEALAAAEQSAARHKAEATAQAPTAEPREVSEEEAEPAQRKIVPVVMIGKEGDKVLITLSAFKSGDDAIPELANEELDRVAERIKGVSDDQKVTIVGYSDTTGTEDANLELSKRRAAAVRDALVTRGVDAEKLEVDGRGAADPLFGGDKPASSPINRRVEIAVPMPPPNVS